MSENIGSNSHEITEDEGLIPENAPDAPETRAKPKKRKFSSKRKKILIVVVVIAVALLVGLWGATPQDYKSVESIVRNSESYIGTQVEVRGKVANWTGGQNFTLLDDNNASIALYVVHERGIPEGFATDKDVVVKGRLENGENGLTIKSTDIQVGCPSKY